MLLMEKEVKRIVAIHFREKYKMEVNPNDMKWEQEYILKEQVTKGLNIGGATIGENGTDSNTD